MVGHLLSLCKALSSTPGNAGRKEGGWGGREEVHGLWLPLLLACCGKPEPSSLERMPTNSLAEKANPSPPSSPGHSASLGQAVWRAEVELSSCTNKLLYSDWRDVYLH